MAGLALLGRTRRALTTHAGLCWARMWQRFSVLALTAMGAVIISGSWLTWKHVGGLAEFVTTTYGRFLLIKILLVLAVVAAGAYNEHLLLGGTKSWPSVYIGGSGVNPAASPKS